MVRRIVVAHSHGPMKNGAVYIFSPSMEHQYATDTRGKNTANVSVKAINCALSKTSLRYIDAMFSKRILGNMKGKTFVRKGDGPRTTGTQRDRLNIERVKRRNSRSSLDV